MARARIKGIPVSPGIALGPLLLQTNYGFYEKRHLRPEALDGEIALLDLAAEKVRQDLSQIISNIPDSLEEYREIISAQLELANDPKVLESVRARIRRRKICAAWAVNEVIDELCALFLDLDDTYLSERAQDIKGLGQRICNALDGVSASEGPGRDGILAAYDLAPADVAQLKLEGIKGLVTVEGGLTSHAAIMARGLKIPALVGAADLFLEARPDEVAIIDSLSGYMLLGPDEGELAFYRHRQKVYDAFEREARASARWPARTTDGKRIAVLANLENTAELAGLKDSGAEGIGLYRTEFSYFGGKLPDEESLYREYRQVAESAAPQKVTLRVLDAGADKILPAQEALREPNPALGMRGIRLCLFRKDIFGMQIRAILRAAVHGNVSIMLPMVSTVAEIDETKKFIGQMRRQLRRDGVPLAEELPVGVMIETPAAVMDCRSIAKKCDFLSIGTNDLLHYLMAIDRTNRHVAYLHDPLHPAFLKSLGHVVNTGRQAGIPVSVCGEIASDPFGVALLVGLGVDILSTAPRFTPALKHMLRKFDTRVCARLANAAMEEADTAKTREELRFALQNSLGSELSFHNILISA